MGKVAGITQAEYARRRGVNKSVISRLVKQGKIKLLANGRLDLKSADRDWSAAKHPSRRSYSKTTKAVPPTAEKRRPPHSNGNGSSGQDILAFTDAAAKKESFAAHLKELEYGEESGRLLDRERVHRTAFEVSRIVRNAILKVPTRVAPLVAAEMDEREVKRILDEELMMALEQLADKEIEQRLNSLRA